MKHRAQVRVFWDSLKDTGLKDEFFYRDLAMKMVREIPINELHKLFKITKTDPGNLRSIRKMSDDNCPNWEKEKIRLLLEEKAILFEIECDLPE